MCMENIAWLPGRKMHLVASGKRHSALLSLWLVLIDPQLLTLVYCHPMVFDEVVAVSIVSGTAP